MSSASKPAIKPKPQPKPRFLSSNSTTEEQMHDPLKTSQVLDNETTEVEKHDAKVIKVNHAETTRQKQETSTPVVRSNHGSNSDTNSIAKSKVPQQPLLKQLSSPSSSATKDNRSNDGPLNLDSKGKVLTFDIREDEEQLEKLDQIIELLVAAGYFRARIKGLSSFDKVC
jgi:hypothetical protein